MGAVSLEKTERLEQVLTIIRSDGVVVTRVQYSEEYREGNGDVVLVKQLGSRYLEDTNPDDAEALEKCLGDVNLALQQDHDRIKRERDGLQIDLASFTAERDSLAVT